MEDSKLVVEFVRDGFMKLPTVACLAGVLVLIFYYWLSLKCRLSPRSVYTIGGSPTLYYLLMLKSLYNRCTKDSPLMCLALQLVTGVCDGLQPKRIWQFFLGFKPVVFFYKPETVEVVLSSTRIIEKASFYRLLHPWLGTSLLTSGGEKWRLRRKMLTPAFHFTILEDFLPVFHEQSSVLVSKLQNLCCEEWIDVVPLMTECTLEIICETAMGVNIHAQRAEMNDYAQAIHDIGEIFFYRISKPWLYPDFIFYLCPSGRKYKKNLQRVHEFTREVIKKKKVEMMLNRTLNPEQNEEEYGSLYQKKKWRAFLEILLEHHLQDSSFTEEDIREEVDLFMFAGHDTTAMALSWTLYFLGLDERVQKGVLDEIDDIFQGDIKREVTRKDLVQMKYLECAIKETLRLHPSVPFFAREASNNFQVLDYTIEKGSVCVIFPMWLHRDKDSFEDPEKFIPERFFPENCARRHPFAYIPFSAGPRNCIGQKFALMEEKTILANIFRRFQVTTLDPRDKINIEANLIIRNVQPLRLRFIPRN